MISEYVYYTIWFILNLVAVVSVIILTIWMLSTAMEWKKEGTEKAKRRMMTLLVTIIVISATTASIYIYIDQNSARYDYTASVTTDQSGVVHIPVTYDEELQDQLRVTSGLGSISIVDTEHGRALRIEFSGNVTVNGRIVRDDRLDDGGLTMLNDTRGIWAWVNLEIDGDLESHVDLDIDLDNANVPGHDQGYEMEDRLEVGWDVYPIIHWME